MSNPTELPDLDKLESLVREYSNTPIHSAKRSKRTVMAEIHELFARRAQPEGEAPQAEPAMWVQYIDGVKTQNVARDDEEKATVESIHRTMAPGTKMTWRALYDHAPAATLSPLCGAQHAESGAALGQVQYSAPITVTSMTLRKREFLEKKGYSVVGYVMQDAKQERCTVAHGKVEWDAAQLDGGQEGSD